ncbi:maleylpyruvate isomerase N-terminal domain-containing protein [Pseudonocardia spinosispora]|uniref:maleylpyruvate isomerase N-terminal domain-containing protein n=1 Tax=Pseudonocardia spinosispora TaxID=103441 RepID=UPI000403984F|nr:maleylpyruvate isomerase N-terminal domain-containing protein [Pseudonocardia spinosispora]
MVTTSIDRSTEAEAFLDARQYTAPDIVSACEGWTAHDVTAHLAAAAAEVTRHLRPYLAGEEVPRTRTFEEREPPFRALDDTTLCRRLDAEEATMRTVIAQVLADDPDAVIPWTGRRMVVAKFLPHLRNEFAVHRWDFVGDDDTGTELLAQPELTEHAVGVLGEILLRLGRTHDPDPDQDFAVALRSENAPDVRVVVESGRASLHLSGRRADEPSIELDAAARTLFIWGRRPDRRGRIRSHVTQPVLRRLDALLSGY